MASVKRYFGVPYMHMEMLAHVGKAGGGGGGGGGGSPPAQIARA